MTEKRDPFLHETFAALHGMPEIGYEEVRTSAYLADRLKEAGYTVTRNIGTTGVLGVLDSGKAGPHFALRADMDALRFESGNIHACGHDANSAMVLTAARRAAQKGIGSGKLFILFQQAEEKVGALQMIETGLLSDIGEMVGIHLRPPQEVPFGQATPALSTSATYFTTVEIAGTPSHSARPHLGVNAIDVAASVITTLNAVREDPTVPHSVKATQIASLGNEKNTIPSRVRLTVDIRAATNSVADSLLEKLKKIVRDTAGLYGASIADLSVEGTPAGEYDDALVDVVRSAVVSVLGQAMPPLQATGGEDFQYFSRLLGIRTAYVGLGSDVRFGLHHPQMSFNHDALDYGADILEKLIELKLR